MTSERVDAPAIAHVPNLDRVVEATSDDALSVRVKVKTDNLGCMSQQCVQTISGLNVPQTRCIVHASRGNHGAMRVERQTDYLGGVSTVGVIQLPRLCIP